MSIYSSILKKAAHLVALERYTKEDHAGQSFLDERTDEAFELVDAPSFLARQALNSDARVGVVSDEDGIHQHRLCELASALPLARQRVRVTSLQNRAGARINLENSKQQRADLRDSTLR